MRKLTVCSVLAVLVLLGSPDIGDVPRIGNCRTMPNQAACMTASDDMPTADDPIRFYRGSTTPLLILRPDGTVEIPPTTDRVRWTGWPPTTLRARLWPDGSVHAQEKVTLAGFSTQNFSAGGTGELALGDAQEKITLAVPVFTSAGATDFRVWDLYVRRTHPDREAEVRATFREVDGSGFVPGGRSLECRYGGDVAETLVIGLNKANLTTKSLERRVTERCQVDGKLGAGTISGVPQEEEPIP